MALFSCETWISSGSGYSVAGSPLMRISAVRPSTMLRTAMLCVGFSTLNSRGSLWRR